MKYYKKAYLTENINNFFADGITYCWNGYSQTDSNKSLLKIIEDDSKTIRENYLKINNEIQLKIFESIGNIEKSNIIYDLFWSSLTAENSLFKSPQITDILKLIALEKELKKIRCEKLIYIGKNFNVAKSLKKICFKLNIAFSYKKIKSTNFLNKKFFKRAIPHFVQSLTFLILYSIKYVNINKTKNYPWFSSNNSILIFSYFVHIEKRYLDRNIFYSKQWEILPKMLEKMNKKINWVHFFSKNPVISSFSKAQKIINDLNFNNYQYEIHTLLNQFMSIKTLFYSARDYVRVYFHSFSLNKKINEKLLNNPYWQMMKDDWKDSLTNRIGMQNIIWLNIFDEILSNMPKQKLCLYLCENQGWEKILLRKFREHHPGKIIGVAHSTISFWDLRYFDSLGKNINQPKPDCIAINGEHAWKELKKSNQNMNIYKKVEALRYLYLSDITNSLKKENKKKELLIIGDILPKTTNNLLYCINKVFSSIKSNYVIKFKPHPANFIIDNKFSFLEEFRSNKPINELLNDEMIVITSGFTSAGLDAYCYGAKVICYLDSNKLNYSILKGVDGVSFFSNSKELSKELNNINHKLRKPVFTENFFWLNRKLPMWKKLLAL